MSPMLFKIYNLPLWLITLLPLRILYIFSDIFYVLIYYVAGYRKKMVFTNLKNAFPEKTGNEIKKIAKAFYRHFCDIFVESFYTLNMSGNEIKKRFYYKNINVLNDIYNKGKSVVMVGGHYNNWDWLTGLPLQSKHKCFAIYRPLRNKYFNLLFMKIREKFGFKTIPMKTALREIVKADKEGILSMTYFLTDQRPARRSIGYWTTFLNQETPWLMGSEVIAKKLNQPVVYMDVQKIKRGFYEIEFDVLFENPGETKEFEITEAHIRKLESSIIKKPEYWLWSHKRWKHKKDEIEKLVLKKDDKSSNSIA